MALEREDFERCWHENVHRVTAYARRHVGADAAPDITSAAFLTAWRVWRTVPEPALPWLISTARGHIRNHQRSVRRAAGLQERLALLEHTAYRGPDASLSAGERMAALRALAAMPPDDREALLLVAWDGLSTDAAAEVLGCRPATLRTRLVRARNRLNAQLNAPADETDRRTR